MSSVTSSSSDPSVATSSSSGSPSAAVGGGFDKARGVLFHLARLILGGIIKPLQSLVGDAAVVAAGSGGETPVENHRGSSRALLTETPQRPAGGGSFSSSSSSSSARSEGSRVVLLAGPGSGACEELAVSSRSLDLRPKDVEGSSSTLTIVPQIIEFLVRSYKLSQTYQEVVKQLAQIYKEIRFTSIYLELHAKYVLGGS